MKKIFFIFLIFFLSLNQTFAIKALSDKDYEIFKKSLHLNKMQKIKIDEIEKNTKKEQEICYAQLKEDISNEKRKELQYKIYQLKLKQDDEIMKILNIFQRKIYKEFNSRVY